MRLISAVLLVVTEIVAAPGVNYCGAKMCGHSNAHTLCRYPAGPAASCAGYVPAPLSAAERARLLARLNRRRGDAARGSRRWPPAGDMMQLRWIEQLAHEAQRWADQCRPPSAPEERDACRDLYSISVGQCVASVVGEAPGLRPESLADLWHSQSLGYRGNVTSYTPSSSMNSYGDFAQMTWSRTFLVGCGRSRFMTEWRGRVRSVERLVCNFAPRGPPPLRPLWSPAPPGSLCPARSRPDPATGLCAYQKNLDESSNVNGRLSIHDHYLLDAVFEIEENETLDYLGRLDETYLTKLAIATVGTTMPNVSLHYSVQMGDALKENEENENLGKIENETVDITVVTETLVLQEKTKRKEKNRKTKIKVIGRPKPYDINELNDFSHDEKLDNSIEIEDLTTNKENDLYVEYGLVETEDEIVNITTTEGVFAPTIQKENRVMKLKLDQKEHIKENTSDGVVGSEVYFNHSSDENNGSIINEKTFEDYLSDPETVEALQEALAQMERTLASPRPAPTPGKVRRELRKFGVDLQNALDSEMGGTTAASVGAAQTDEAAKSKESEKSQDHGPMLNMVLKYIPLLKPYEKNIIGAPNGHCNRVYFELSLYVTSLVIHVTVL